MAERSQLWVEGSDDDHTIRHLLIRHGVDYDHKPWSTWIPSIEQAGNKDQLLQTVERSVRASTNRAVGFVLDADSSPWDQWKAMLSRLQRAGVNAPEDIPLEGFVGQSQTYHTRVGAWLMPDNQQAGTLENFLMTLVKEGDPLLPHARESTIQAKNQFEANYRDTDKKKAVLHAWLAWQSRPGVPYGTAIKAQFFRQDKSRGRTFCSLVSPCVQTRLSPVGV